MSNIALSATQVRYTNKAFWRNPASAFFTFAFPLMFLAIFTSLITGDITIGDLNINLATYFVMAEAVFGIISACYTNIAISVSFQRDQGILKRTRGTPIPAWSYLSARVIHSMIIGAILVVITVVFGIVFYSANVPAGVPLLQFLLSIVIGSLSFAALALALTSAIPNADASPAIVNASILPLLFLSGIFIPIGDDTPAWITTVSNIFPVRHFFEAMANSFLGNGPVRALPFDWSDLLIVAAWGLAGLAIAARFFSWEPRK